MNHAGSRRGQGLDPDPLAAGLTDVAVIVFQCLPRDVPRMTRHLDTIGYDWIASSV